MFRNHVPEKLSQFAHVLSIDDYMYYSLLMAKIYFQPMYMRAFFSLSTTRCRKALLEFEDWFVSKIFTYRFLI